MTCKDSFDSFYALYRFNPKSQEQFTRVRESFADIERQVRMIADDADDATSWMWI